MKILSKKADPRAILFSFSPTFLLYAALLLLSLCTKNLLLSLLFYKFCTIVGFVLLFLWISPRNPLSHVARMVMPSISRKKTKFVPLKEIVIHSPPRSIKISVKNESLLCSSSFYEADTKHGYLMEDGFTKLEREDYALLSGIEFTDQNSTGNEDEEAYTTDKDIYQDAIEDETSIIIINENYSYYGEVFEGLSHGSGKEILEAGTGTYVGQFWNGFWHGWGEHKTSNGDRYAGSWLYSLRNGIGELTSYDGTTYRGEFKNGTKHGDGWTRYRHGDWYSGEYKHGEMDGSGVYHFSNGDIYEGSWQNGFMHGYGTYVRANGESKSGIWEQNVLSVTVPVTNHYMNRSVEVARLCALNGLLVPRVGNEVRNAVIRGQIEAIIALPIAS